MIAGHGRVLAARKLGMRLYQRSLTVFGNAKGVVLADNRIAMNAGWDGDWKSDLQEAGFDLGLTGFLMMNCRIALRQQH